MRQNKDNNPQFYEGPQLHKFILERHVEIRTIKTSCSSLFASLWQIQIGLWIMREYESEAPSAFSHSALCGSSLHGSIFRAKAAQTLFPSVVQPKVGLAPAVSWLLPDERIVAQLGSLPLQHILLHQPLQRQAEAGQIFLVLHWQDTQLLELGWSMFKEIPTTFCR